MEEDRRIEPGTEFRAGETKERAGQEAQFLREELQRKGESLVNDQKASLAAILNGFANALDKSAPNFEEEGQPNTARYTRQAAQSLQTFSRDLRERDIDSLKRKMIEVGRNQPGLLAGGAVALGFLASRFLRSSAERSETDYRQQQEPEKTAEELIIGTETGFRAEESKPSSPILTEREIRAQEKEFPK